jgi:hypothetical protein
MRTLQKHMRTAGALALEEDGSFRLLLGPEIVSHLDAFERTRAEFSKVVIYAPCALLETYPARIASMLRDTP